MTAPGNDRPGWEKLCMNNSATSEHATIIRMKTIHKFSVGEGVTGHALPPAATVVRFAPQNGGLFMWVETYPEVPPIMRIFKVFGTGWEIPPGAQYRGSCEVNSWIWHLYEVTPQ